MVNYVVPIMVMLFALVIGIVGILFIVTLMRSHRLRLRYIVNDKKFVEDYWVMEHSDKDTGDIYWKSVFFQKKMKCEKPPTHILDVGKKGKFYAELYVTGVGSDGTLEGIWINDSVDVNNDTLELHDGTKVTETFKPFTTTQRAFATRQFKKADERRSNRWDVQKIANFVFMGMFLVCVIAGMIFMPDILDKQREIESIRLSEQELHREIVDKQLAITNALGVKVENWDVVVSQSVKQGTSNVVTTNNEVQPME